MHPITRRGHIYHRTKVMTLAAAERFARCLAANHRFQAVTVEEQPLAKGEERFYVRYQPASEAAQVALYRGEAEGRAGRAADQGTRYEFVLDEGGRYFHCLNTATGEVYETTERTCSCADFYFRGRQNGVVCKHIRMLNEGHSPVRGWTAPAPAAPAPAPVPSAAVLTEEEARRARARRDRELLFG